MSADSRRRSISRREMRFDDRSSSRSAAQACSSRGSDVSCAGLRVCVYRGGLSVFVEARLRQTRCCEAELIANDPKRTWLLSAASTSRFVSRPTSGGSAASLLLLSRSTWRREGTGPDGL